MSLIDKEKINYRIKVFQSIERGDYADAAIRIAQANRTLGTLCRVFDPEETRDYRGRWAKNGSESPRINIKNAIDVSYCKIVKKLCIVEATSTLQTNDYGFQFWNAMNACMDRHNCLGVA